MPYDFLDSIKRRIKGELHEYMVQNVTFRSLSACNVTGGAAAPAQATAERVAGARSTPHHMSMAVGDRKRAETKRQRVDFSPSKTGLHVKHGVTLSKHSKYGNKGVCDGHLRYLSIGAVAFECFELSNTDHHSLFLLYDVQRNENRTRQVHRPLTTSTMRRAHIKSTVISAFDFRRQSCMGYHF